MAERRVRRGDRGQVGSSFEPYYRREAGSQRHRPYRKWLFRVLKLGMLLVIAGVVVGWGLVIGQVRVESTAYQAEIEASARRIISSQRGWSNLLLLPADELAAAITEDYNQRITAVSITKNWLSKAITIKAIDRSPQLSWQTNNQLFSIDQTGRVISRVGERPAGLPLVVDTSSVTIAVNDQIVPAQFVEFTKAVWQEMPQASGLRPVRARIEQTTNELLVDTDQGWFVRFDTAANPQEQLQSVKAVLADAKKSGQPITSYIDVRLAYKVYYR